MTDDMKSLFSSVNSSENGLTQQEAQKRLEQNGRNAFPTGKQKSILLILLNQFKSAIMIILFVAIILSLIIGEYANIIFIGGVIVINTIIGFVQEYHAERSAQRLKKHIKIMTKVLRDRESVIIDSEELVVGDIVYLETGSKVPADIRLIETTNLKVDESILTGESEGVIKSTDEQQGSGSIFKSNMVYAGTVILMGRAVGVVVKTGNDTEFGKIASRIVEIKNNPSPLTLRINKFTKQISIAFLVIALTLSIILFVKGYNWYNIFFSVVALTVSAIPEGLTTGMTICLSISSSKMAKKKVVVKQLSAVEGLGSCNIIASDKTGTLTVNEQTAQKIILPNETCIDITGSGYKLNGKLVFPDEKDKHSVSQANLITMLGDINNESFVKIEKHEIVTGGDSIDIAFKILAFKNNTRSNVDILSQLPYESDIKCSAVHYQEDGKQFVTIKGAMSVVLDHCDTMLKDGKVTKLDKALIESQNTKLASDGFRVIALCYGKHNKTLKSSRDLDTIGSLTFVGIVGFIDPIREDTYLAIQECKQSGIDVKMITGDHHLTAFYIAKQLQIAETIDQVATGEDLTKYEKKGQKAFDSYVNKIKVFARVSPIQKQEIIASYKRLGNFVSVTGDGVNDVLALKEAHIGISVGSGADVAKETADMIIADDKFSSIVTGIEEGKKAYNNVRNIVYLLMSTGICEVMLYFLSVLCNLSFPLTGVQFLWLNLVTNGIQSNVFAFEKNTLTKYNKKVRKTSENIFNKLMITECLVATFYIGIMGFLLYLILLKTGMNPVMARTYLLTFMVFMESAQAFNCRNEYLSAFRCKFKNNPILIVTIFASFVFQILALYIAPVAGLLDMTQIQFGHVILMALFAITQVLLMEIFKLGLRKKLSK